MLIQDLGISNKAFPNLSPKQWVLISYPAYPCLSAVVPSSDAGLSWMGEGKDWIFQWYFIRDAISYHNQDLLLGALKHTMNPIYL